MISIILRARRRIGAVLAVAVLLLIFYGTLTPARQTLPSDPWCLVCGTYGGVDVILNIAMFVPLGVALAWIGWPAQRSILAMAALTVAIESAQLLIVRGRDPALGDVFANTIGGAIGFGIGASMETWLIPGAATARRLATGWLFCWLAVQGLAAYTLRPAPTDSPYYGQIKRRIGRMRPFTGDVIAPTVDGMQFPNTRFRDAASVRGSIKSPGGAVWRTGAVPRDPARRLTLIARVADSTFAEVALIAQDRTDLVFGVRTHAADLRLRPVYFALRDVFPAEPAYPRDTVMIEARQTPALAHLRAQTGGSTKAAEIRLGPAMFWRFFLPRTWYAGGSIYDAALDVAWMAAGLLPVVFWVMLAAGYPGSGHRPRWMIAIIAIVLAGAGLVPVLSGVTPPLVQTGLAIVFCAGAATPFAREARRLRAGATSPAAPNAEVDRAPWQPPRR